MRRHQPLHSASFLFSVALLFGAAACGRGGRPGVQTASSTVPVDSAIATATFDSAWARIGATYYDPSFRGLDWTAIRDTLRPIAAASRDMEGVRRVLHELFLRLGESHFALIPREVVDRRLADTVAAGEPGDTGMELRLVDGVALVSRVAPGSPAAREGIEPGWILERAGGTDIDSLVRTRRAEALPFERSTLGIVLPFAVMARLDGAAGSTIRLVLRDRTGTRVERTVARRQALGMEVRYGHLPPQRAHVEHERRLDIGGCVGVLRFNTWMTPILPKVDAAVDDLRDCRGIIIDLRGNLGGVAAMVMGIGGHFLDSAVSLGTTSARGMSLRYLANPRRVGTRGQPVAPYAGPLAILVDGLSVSTSEIFAAGLQSLGRARVFGEPTPGQALPSTITRLPNGDVMQHVIADFVGVDGRRLEKTGVVPDERIPLRRADLLAGRDAPMLAALRWIDRSGTPSAAAARAPDR